MNYRSIADLNRTILGNLHKVPRDLELVVGIPRSGLLVANLIALHMNLPFTDIDGFLAGRLLSAGRRLGDGLERAKLARPCSVLVVDDSLNSGVEMRRARARIAAAPLQPQVSFCAVYGRRETAHEADIVMELCPLPRVFEWNLLNSSCLANACMDIDGVLCRDPTEHENDDGPRYQQFLLDAEPYLLPAAPVGCLVTSRLEKYRGLTEQWLMCHGVRYRQLFMLDLPSKEARIAQRAHAPHKANKYRETQAILFIESSYGQAVEIADRTAKPVLCVETNELIYPAGKAIAKGVVRKSYFAAGRRAKFATSRIGQMLLRYVRYGQ